MTIAIQTAIDRLIDARSTRRLLAPFSETDGDLTLDHAYAIQDALHGDLDRRGERPIGWKLGATSPAGQALMGVQEPAFGFLRTARYGSGSDVSISKFVNLGVEAEVAFKMRSELAGPGVTAETALRAVESAMPALELLDFVFSGKPRAADYIASSIVAGAIVLGSPFARLDELDLTTESVEYEHNGEVVGTYTAAEVMGNPLKALAWLANRLGARGLALKPGDIVMSGAISKIVRPGPGDKLAAKFVRLGSVSMKVVS